MNMRDILEQIDYKNEMVEEYEEVTEDAKKMIESLENGVCEELTEEDMLGILYSYTQEDSLSEEEEEHYIELVEVLQDRGVEIPFGVEM